MASHTGGNQTYSPSAPPDPNQSQVAYPYQPPPPPSVPSLPYARITHTHSSSTSGYSFDSDPNRPPQGYGHSPYAPQPQQQQNVYSSFPAGTHPDVIRSFQMADRNQNGYIEENELQEALAWNYQKFSTRTLRLLTFLFRNPYESFSRIGPKEFADIWSCIGQWWAIFERFDRDHSRKIDALELREALLSLGYALPQSVLNVLFAKYDDGSGRKVELSFDSFVECGMIVKGLTEKFKEKDARYTGSATLSYDTFMSMIIPFLV
ncbi:hypothetical protein CASFOL_037452 [Castilleja foliolosa]|uniref:EF-hand domain-containing protein n=1 Tax=Castilleja foliolosa TaxID=1961234 RepID=A0ABD3BQ27_9LAMI